MPLRSRFLTSGELLCSIIFAAAYCISAVQPLFGQSLLFAIAGAQKPKEQPDVQQQQPTHPG